MPTAEVENVRATFATLLPKLPKSATLAIEEATKLLEDVKHLRGEVRIGDELVVEEIYHTVDDLKECYARMGEPIASVDEEGELVFRKNPTEGGVILGEGRAFATRLSSLRGRKHRLRADYRLDKSYPNFPDNQRSVQLIVMAGEFKRANEEDKATFEQLHLLSLLSFCLVELGQQLATWARVVHHFSSLGRSGKPSNPSMAKFIKVHKVQFDDLGSAETVLYQLHSDLCNHEDHMNPPGISDPSGSGLRYMTERPTAYMKDLQNRDEYFQQVLAIQAKIRGNESVTTAEYRMWLTSIEFKATDGPSRPMEDSEENRAACKLAWDIVFNESLEYYKKMMKQYNETFPVDEKELTFADHVDPRAHAAAMAAEGPPVEIRTLMANGKQLQVMLKTGPCDANIGELQRGVLEDGGETGGGCMILYAQTNFTLSRSYHSIRTTQFILPRKYRYLLNTNNAGPAGHMQIATNNPRNFSKCMSKTPQRSDPSGAIKYMHSLAQQSVRGDDSYDIVDEEPVGKRPLEEADAESAKRPLEDAALQGSPKRQYVEE